MTGFSFQVFVETDDTTGALLSAYFQIRKGKVHLTQEYADGAAFADYNSDGELLGIEMLATCKVSIVDKVAANEPPEVRARTKEFLRKSGPRQLIAV